eukprot:TRINITY_DN65905_c11_g4_i1.p1 TRINITY_DN65905_c11_g4~~TRINITY_DN65905_c11_g4_i1.p1  ORF type:complete len:659 (-),score=11.77 TRINITY_DN65905_c11_g4_i1:92-2068(-)
MSVSELSEAPSPRRDTKATQELERQLQIANNATSHLELEVKRRDTTIAVLNRELAAKTKLLEKANAEVQQLRNKLSDKGQLSESLMNDLRRKQEVNSQLCQQIDTPSTQFMHYCFEIGITPNPQLLRSLHQDPTISCTDPLSFEDIAALSEVLSMRSTHNTQHWQQFESISVALATDDCYAVLAEIITSTPTLTRLAIASPSDAGLATILNSLQTVHWVNTLSISNPTISASTLSSLFQTLTQRRITVPSLAIPGTVTPPQPELFPIALAELDLHNSPLPADSFDLVQLAVMRVLNLSHQSELTNAKLETILSGCPVLQSLNIDHCPLVTDAIVPVLNKLGCNVHQLHILSTPIYNITLQHVTTLYTDWFKTTKMDCPKLVEIPTELRHFALLSLKCPHLSRLNMTGVTLGEREMNVLADGVTGLADLSLPACRVSGLQRFVPRLRRLQYLNLTNSKIVRDHDLQILPSTLQHLDLSYCYYLTDAAIIHISGQCVNLVKLSLRHCCNVTNESLKYLGDRNTKLTNLDLRGCKKITSLAIDRLATQIPLEEVLHEDYQSALVGSQEPVPETVDAHDPIVMGSDGVTHNPTKGNATPTVGSPTYSHIPTKPSSPKPPISPGHSAATSPHKAASPTSLTFMSPTARTYQYRQANSRPFPVQ